MDMSYGPGMLALSSVHHAFSSNCSSTPEEQALWFLSWEGQRQKPAYLVMPLLLCSLPVLRPWSVRWHL